MAIKSTTDTATAVSLGTDLIEIVKYDNDYIAAEATIFGITYEYVFKPCFTDYTLGKFRVNGRTYNQLAAGDTDLPGERGVAERAFHAVQNEYDVAFRNNAIGHKVPYDLLSVSPDEFTDAATDNTDTELSLTLDGIRDDSNVTLTHGDYIYDHHADTMHEVGVPHHRGRGACARELEIRELPNGEFRTLNLSHIDTRLARGRWEVLPGNTDVDSFTEYVTDDTVLETGDVVTDLSEVADGLTDRSTMRVTAIRTVVGVGTRAVLTPETSFDYTNELNIRAVPITDLINAATIQK